MSSKFTQKTISFEVFWEQLNRLNTTDHRAPNFEAMARSYLNVSSESLLLKEAQDIFEDLRMMVNIYLQQVRVMENFGRHLEDIHESEQQHLPNDLPNIMTEINKIRRDMFRPHSAEDPLAPQSPGNSNQLSAGNDTEDTALDRNRKNAIIAAKISGNTRDIARRVKEAFKRRSDELESLMESSEAVSLQVGHLILLAMFSCYVLLYNSAFYG